MPVAVAQQAARAAATRERILETAERLFRTLGYQKTAVADIARDLGMSPANLYRFFASKSAINEAITARLLGGLVAEIEAVAAGPGSAEQRFRRLLSTKFERSLVLFFDERRMHDMVAAAMSEHWGVIEVFIGGIHGAMARVIADGMRQGEFAPGDAAREAGLVFDAVVGWTHPLLIENCIVQRGRSVEQMREDLAMMTDFLVRALRRP